MTDSVFIFDRDLVRLHRERAAAIFAAHDFLFREVGVRLAERLDDIKLRFPLTLELGCRTGILAELISNRGGVECLVRSDLSEAMARLAVAREESFALTAVADEELLPFRAGWFDLVISNLTLHWANDLLGTLLQVRQVLKPNGLFLASMTGGTSLAELRAVLADAENFVEGSWSPRVSPFASIHDVGVLLQLAGFVLPVVDCDTIMVSYPNPLHLFLDLRGMGEANATLERRRIPLRRATLNMALDRYYTIHADAEGRVPATFQILYLTAWRA